MWAKINGVEFEIKTKEDLALLLGEKEKPVEVVVKRHYTKRRSSRAWSSEEDVIVRENTPRKAKRLLHGRTLSSIYVRRSLLRGKKSKKNYLTEREQKYIKDALRSGKKMGQIARDLGRPYSTISSYVVVNGLRS